MERKIIAVDFDGCLVTNKFPEIGSPKEKIISALKAEQDNGARVILWTCRVGKRLIDAVSWCANNGITLEAINENLPDIVKNFGSDSRKIFAHEYWDDRAVRIPPEGEELICTN